MKTQSTPCWKRSKLVPKAKGNGSVVSDGPRRTCIGCRAVKDKRELVRVAVVDGVLTLDKKAVIPGRGAYLCNSGPCLEIALQKKEVFSRALRRTVSIPAPDALRDGIKSKA